MSGFPRGKPRSSAFDEEPEEKEDKTIGPLIGTAVPREDHSSTGLTRKEKVELNKRLPVWKQEVLDEQGRKRFHGAFKGGFSAGYFNTVGSKEGWTPSQFVSSRSNRSGEPQQRGTARPEDFMDEEDFQELGLGAHGIREKEEFAAAGAADADKAREQAILGSGAVSDAFIGPARDPIGVKLLKLMGWRQGKGIGPRRKRQNPKTVAQTKKRIYGVTGITPQVNQKGKDANSSEESDDDNALAPDLLYAPEDTNVALFAAKDNFYGVGYDPYKSSGPEGHPFAQVQPSNAPGAPKRIALGAKLQSQPRGFGLGALEDADDDEVYTFDSMDNYDSSLGMPEPKRAKISDAPVSSAASADPYGGVLPSDRSHINGFIRARRPVTLMEEFPGPDVPRDFNPRRRLALAQNPAGDQQVDKLNSVVLADKKLIAQLTVEQRGRLLGEKPLQARMAPPPMPPPPPPHLKYGLASRFAPAVQQEAAQPEKQPGNFLPFKDDPSKQLRYEFWLKVQRGQMEQPKFWNDGLTDQERANEHDEFKKTWGMFGQLPTMLAKRFERAGSNVSSSQSNQIKAEDHTKVAAANKMFGALTRTVEDWAPERLLCKRFNVPNPRKVAYKSSRSAQEMKTSDFNFADDFGPVPDASGAIRLEPDLNPEQELKNVSDDEAEEYNPEQGTGDDETSPTESQVNSTGLDHDKPAIDLFKAIFEDDEEEIALPEAQEPSPLSDPNIQPVASTGVNPFSPDQIDQMFNFSEENNDDIGPPAPVQASIEPAASPAGPPQLPYRVIKDFSKDRLLGPLMAQVGPLDAEESSDSDSDSSSSDSSESSSRDKRHKRKKSSKHKRHSKSKEKRRHKKRSSRRDKDKDKDKHKDKRKSDKKRKRSRSPTSRKS